MTFLQEPAFHLQVHKIVASPEREVGLKLSTFQPASLQQNLKSTTSRLYIRKKTPQTFISKI